MQLRKLLPIIIVLPCYAKAATNKAVTLCHPNEQVIFSCFVNRSSHYNRLLGQKYKRLKTEKILSLCATNPITPQSGHLWYRFGSANKAPDFTYPSSDSASPTEFSVEFEQATKGWENSISFTNNDFTYTISSSYGAYDGADSGVEIAKSQQHFANYSCNGNANLYNKNYIDNIQTLYPSDSPPAFSQTATYK